MTGRFSPQITEQVRQASDIAEVVSAHVTLKRAGKNLKGLCPFHNEKSPSFHVHPERQTFKCFGCGAGGDVFKFIQLRENVEFKEAVAILATRAGITLAPAERPADGSSVISKVDLERVNRWAAKWFQQQLASPLGEKARRYISERGITDASVEQFALGYAPETWDSLIIAAKAANVPSKLLVAAGLAKPREDGSPYDAFRNRLMFPIRDAMDRIVGFGGRTLGDDPAKYINSPQSVLFDKSRCLYGIATAKEAFRESRRAIVVEGYVDCLIAQQSGFADTVATLGTALTVEHVRLLQRYVDGAVLVFDSDEAGQRAADQSLQIFLTEQLPVRLAHVPKGKDPADFLVSEGPAAFEGVLTSGVEALELKWKQVLRQHQNEATGLDRRRAVEEFLGLIARSAEFGACDPIQRGLVLNQVGKLLGLTNEEVQRQLRIVARRLSPSPASRPGAAEDRPSWTPDAAVTAMRSLLEVLLNVPSYYESVASQFDSELLPDAELREIAVAVADLARSRGEFTLAELLGRFESVETARRIIDLQSAGERRGNYAATVEGAVTRLQQEREQHRVRAWSSQLRQTVARDAEQIEGKIPAAAIGVEADESAKLRAMGEAARRLNHFAARKHLATPIPAGARPVAPPGAG